MKIRINIVASDCFSLTFKKIIVHGRGDEGTIMLGVNEAEELHSKLGSMLDALEDDNANLSNCCSAPIRFSDICAACGEHCQSMQDEILSEIGQVMQ
jgi:hypothetical protein